MPPSQPEALRSPTKRNLSPERAADLARSALGVPVARATELPGGFFGAVWRIDGPDGPLAALKLAPGPDAPLLRCEAGMMQREAMAMRAARALGLPAPAVLSEGGGDIPFLLMEWAEGAPLSDIMADMPPGDLDTLYEEMGALLARLHGADAEGWPCAYTATPWRVRFTAMVDDILLDLRDFSSPPPGGEAAIRDAVLCAGPSLDRVTTLSPLHRDLWMGNIIVTVGEGRPPRVRALLDWERTLAGDPLLDLVFAFVEGDLRGDFSGAFYRGYGPRALERAGEERLLLYQMYFLLLLLAEGAARGTGAQEEERARELLQTTLRRLRGEK